MLFPARYVRETACAINDAGGNARYWELDSPEGHDAFLKEFERLDPVLREAVTGQRARVEPATAVHARA